MFREIAIEPEVMAHWEWFLKLYDKFGYHEGMLIADFPTSWRREVIERANELVREGVNQEIKVRSMVSRLQLDSFKAGLYSSGRQPGEHASWLDKAKNQNPPFDAIVACVTGECLPPVVVAKDFFWEDPLLMAKRQNRIARNATCLVGAAEKLLRQAKEIRFVDRFFNPKKPEKRNPFVRLVDYLHECNPEARRLQIYTQLVLEEATPDDYNRFLEHELPTGFSLEVFFLEKLEQGENLHPRFLMADIGGLQYDHGLDEGDGTCVVNVLEKDFKERLWEEYSPDSKVFGFHRRFPSIVLGG